MTAIRNLIPIFLVLSGLGVVGATLWILFADDSGGPPLPGLFTEQQESSEQEAERKIVSQLDEEAGNNDQPEQSPILGQFEKVLPERSAKPHKGGIRITLLRLPEKKPIAVDDMVLQVSYNEYPLGRIPEATARPGVYLLDQLMPGQYRFSAYSSKGYRGEASCRLETGQDKEVSLFLHLPAQLSLQVVDARDGRPVVGAKVDAQGFIENGQTDENGMLRSARFFVPHTDTILRISHSQYFSSLFEPLRPELSGARQTGQGWEYRLPLHPLTGDLHLTGTVVDEEDNPMPRMALFLLPRFPGTATDAYLSSFTDRSSAFVFNDLPPGNYLLKGTLGILNSSYIARPPAVFEEEILLLPGQSLTDQVIRCKLKKVPFLGYAFLADSHQPASGAVVAFSPYGANQGAGKEDPLYFAPITVEPDGFFSTKETFPPEDLFGMLLRGNIRITHPDGHESVYRPMQMGAGLRQLQADILEGLPLTLWITSAPEAQITGQVLDAAGTPLERVNINATCPTANFQGHKRARSDASGYFTLPDLFAGEWLIQATAHNGPVLEQRLKITSETNTLNITMQMQGRCSLVGRIVSDERPRRLSVKVRGPGYETESRVSVINSEYAFEHLPPGKTWITVELYTETRFQDKNLLVQEGFVELVAGRPMRKDFNFFKDR